MKHWFYILPLLTVVFLASCKKEDVNPVATCRKAPEVFILEKTPGGASVEIILETNANLWTVAPSYAVWARYPGQVEETIYATCKAAKEYWDDEGFQAEGLPVWYRIRREAGYTSNELELDAITTATPTKSKFTIHWEPESEFLNDTIELFIEANLPFDYNYFYNQNLGDNGQPSLIWSVSFTMTGGEFMQLGQPRVIGHSHPRGTDNEIYSDFNGITTAVQIFRRITLGGIEGD